MPLCSSLIHRKQCAPGREAYKTFYNTPWRSNFIVVFLIEGISDAGITGTSTGHSGGTFNVGTVGTLIRKNEASDFSHRAVKKSIKA